MTIRLKATLEDGSVVEENPALTFTLGDCDVLQVSTGRKLISPQGATGGVGVGDVAVRGWETAPVPLQGSLPTVSFLQALDLCVQLLEMGETALIVSDAKYCYGAQGR